MRKKLKKGAKLLVWSSAVLVILLIVGYCLAAKYYLPRYFQKNIIPELVKEAGIRGFSGKITNVGAFGADLGEMVIGSPDNPTLKADKVTLTYSLQKSWQRGHLVVDQIVFSGVKLKCAVKHGKLVVNDFDQEKFLTELKNRFVKPKNGKLLSIQEIVVRKSLLELDINEDKLLIPFELFIKPVDADWNKLQANLKITIDESTISVGLNWELEQELVKAEIDGTSSLRHMIELCNLLKTDMLPTQGIYEGETSFKGSMALRFTPKFAVSAFDIEGKLRHGRIDVGDVTFRNLVLPSGRKKTLNYSIRRHAGKFTLDVSNCRMQKPVAAEIRNFSCDFSLAKQLPINFSGRLKLPLEAMSLWRIMDIKPLYGITFDSQVSGSYDRTTQAWKFAAMPWEPPQNNIAYEWFFKYDDNYIFTTVKQLSIAGAGQGSTGKVNIKLDIPKVNVSGRQRLITLRGFTLNEKFNIAVTNKLKADFKHAEGELRVAHFSGSSSGTSWSSNAMKLNGSIDISHDVRANQGKFALVAQNFAIKNTQELLSADAIKTTGQLNFSLERDMVACKSLRVRLQADKALVQHNGLRAGAKHVTLQQTLNFGQELALESGKSEYSANELSLDSNDITITAWRVNAKSTLMKHSVTDLNAHLKTGVNFGKVVCKIADRNKVVASSGKVDLAVPVINNKPVGKMVVTANIPRGWYFSPTLKGRGSGIKLDTELMLKCSDDFWQLSTIDGMLRLDNATVSNPDYYLKFDKLQLMHKILFNQGHGLGEPDSAKLHLVSPTLKGGDKGSIVKLDAFDFGMDYQRGRKAAVTALLRSHNLRVKSFIIGDCNIPKLELSGQWNNGVAVGRLKFSNAAGKLLKPLIIGKGISAEIPLGWPELPAKQVGMIHATSISSDLFTASKVELQLDSTPDTVVFQGNFTNNIFRLANNFCFGKVALPPADFSIDVDLSVPTYKTLSPVNLGRISPAWDGIIFAGTLQGKANIKYAGNGIKYRTELKLSDAELYSANFAIKQLTTTWNTDNSTQDATREQAAAFGLFEYGKFILTDGKVKYRISGTDKIAIGRNSFRWLGSEAFIRPFTLKQSSSADKLETYCHNMPASKLLGFLGLKQVDCDAGLDGVINARLNQHQITIADAKFSSIPDNPETIKIAGLAKMIMPRRNSEQDFACELLNNGFRYNWLKVGFALLPTGTKVAIRADGCPITSPAFVYDDDTGKFTRCEPGKGNIAGEIALFTELLLPSK